MCCLIYTEAEIITANITNSNIAELVLLSNRSSGSITRNAPSVAAKLSRRNPAVAMTDGTTDAPTDAALIDFNAELVNQFRKRTPFETVTEMTARKAKATGRSPYRGSLASVAVVDCAPTSVAVVDCAAAVVRLKSLVSRKS